ncbi:H-2 class I histocompatibility antigen, Q9 alpha chain-like [Elgaria multicarinata webbii]|uniref:H-2 class I histocompatibility antigen, Q9 alpha chain-like n=1 Tax=Elgaria multicarinata webbii TaxID=159646 RepID=UPI002FCD4B74
MERGLFVLLLGVMGACAGSSSSSTHSQCNFYMGVSEPREGIPWFTALSYVDDQLFVQYDSDTKKVQPRVPWIKKAEKDDARYWETFTQALHGWDQMFRVNVEDVRNYYNQSKGFHTWQLMYGCELRDDGSKGGYIQYGYDGSDYIALDKETLTWTAADVPAQNTKRTWEAEPALAQRDKAYLEVTCIEWLRKYLDYGKETLLRKERPVVKVTSQADHNDMETLVCQAHGFYPKAIETTWTRDGEVMEHKTFRRDVAPNSDGTYHAWLSIKIDPKDRGHYRCRVGHDGLSKPLVVAWEEPGASNLGLIIRCAVGTVSVLLVAGIVGIYFYKKRQDSYRAASSE